MSTNTLKLAIVQGDNKPPATFDEFWAKHKAEKALKKLLESQKGGAR